MVEIVQGEKLYLSCMGLEEVSIFVNGEVSNDARIELEKEFKPEAEFPYVANLVFSNLTPADGSVIECIQRPGSSNAQSLHLWKYRVVGKPNSKHVNQLMHVLDAVNTSFSLWTGIAVDKQLISNKVDQYP